MSAYLIRVEVRCDELTLVSLYDGAEWIEQRHWAKGDGCSVYAAGVLPLSATWRETLYAVADRPGVEIAATVFDGGNSARHAVRVEVRS